MDRVGFISLPNRCNGCPLDVDKNIYRTINRCDMADEDSKYKIQYRLNDLGKQVCKVSRKKKLREVVVVSRLLTSRRIKDIRQGYRYMEDVKRVTVSVVKK